MAIESSQTSLDAVMQMINRNPGLVIGPGATSYRGAMADVRRGIVRRLSKLALPESGDNYLDLGDVIASVHPAGIEAYRTALKEELLALRPSADLASLAATNWVASVSLTPDVLFERALTDRLDARPSSRTLTVISAPRMSVPPRTNPVYKLLGMLTEQSEEARLVYSQSDLLFRVHGWPGLLSTFPDFLQDSPLFFVGTDDVTAITAQFLASVYSGPRPHPSRLIFLRSDLTPTLPAVSGVLKRAGAQVIVVDSDIRGFINAVEQSRGVPRRLDLRQPISGSSATQHHAEELDALKYIAERVPRRDEKNTNFTHEASRSIVDALFRPTANDWRPYLQKLDLQRSLLPRLVEVVAEEPTSGSQLSTIAVHGPAAVGKTTLLRRLAVELSADNYLVLWCNRVTGESTGQAFRKLIKPAQELLQSTAALRKKLIVIADDPWQLKLSAPDLLGQLERAQIPVTLIIGFRSSDYSSTDSSEFLLPGLPSQEFELPHQLDDNERKSLPAMLVGIGACKDEAEGHELINKNPYQRAADVLCSMWFLLPETRSQFQSSLEDEYRRLGDPRSAIEAAAAGAARAGELARSAYEAVTVASSLRIGLPVEVLVRAIGADYSDWIASTQPGKPVWGLLYDEFEEESDSFLYRTRNEIVTLILLQLVNGSLGGHSGQYRLLKQMISACTVSSPPYRTFLHDVLVRSRDKLENILSYEQGIDLYDAARTAMPYQDRSIEHHRGLWIRNVGGDLAAADEQLKAALEVPDYPGSIRDEPLQYIHTSLAASILAQVRSGTTDRATGFERVMDHLLRASNSKYFNANQSHVMARTLLEMAEIQGSGPETISFDCLNKAMEEIERSLQTIGSPGRTAVRYQRALGMFEDLQRKVVETTLQLGGGPDVGERIFANSKSQVGYELWARKLLSSAVQTNTGSDYNVVSEYLATAFKAVADAKLTPSPELRAIRVDLIVRWRIQQVRGKIDWHTFHADLEQLVRTPKYRDDNLKKFYYAVALYQIGRIIEANAVFAGLRREASLPYTSVVRCYYVGPEGFAKRFQGIAESGRGGRDFVRIGELGDDLLVKGSLEAGPGGTVHVYIGFAAIGPFAVTRSPHPGDLLMPSG